MEDAEIVEVETAAIMPAGESSLPEWEPPKRRAKKRGGMTQEHFEALRTMSMSGTPDVDLASAFNTTTRKIQAWRHNDPVWFAAFRALRGNQRAKRQKKPYTGKVKPDMEKVAQIIEEKAKLTLAEMGEKNRFLAMEIAGLGLDKAHQQAKAGNLSVDSWGDVDTIVGFTSKVAGWNQSPIQVNVSAFSEMSPANVSPVIDIQGDEEMDEREDYFRG